MKYPVSQQGHAHLVVIAAVVVIAIGAIGYKISQVGNQPALIGLDSNVASATAAVQKGSAVSVANEYSYTPPKTCKVERKNAVEEKSYDTQLRKQARLGAPTLALKKESANQAQLQLKRQSLDKQAAAKGLTTANSNYAKLVTASDTSLNLYSSLLQSELDKQKAVFDAKVSLVQTLCSVNGSNSSYEAQLSAKRAALTGAQSKIYPSKGNDFVNLRRNAVRDLSSLNKYIHSTHNG